MPIPSRSQLQSMLAQASRTWFATLRNPLGAVGAVLLTLVVLAAVAAPLIAPVGPDVSSLDDVYAPISPEHPLGGDSAGRDLLARLVWGARISLGGAVLAVVVAMLIGVPIGLIGGYYGRAFDVAANWVSDRSSRYPESSSCSRSGL